MQKFSAVLKDLMRKRGVTPKALSVATGIPVSTISEWTTGREPRFNANLAKVAKFFGVPLEYLLTGEHPDDAILRDLKKSIEPDFLEVHRGIYRITIEKTESITKKGDNHD